MTTMAIAISAGAFVVWTMFCVWLLRLVLRNWRLEARDALDMAEREKIDWKKAVEEERRRLSEIHNKERELEKKSLAEQWGGGAKGSVDADADFTSPYMLPLVNSRLVRLGIQGCSLPWEDARFAEIRHQATEGKSVKREDLLWALGAIGRLATADARKALTSEDVAWLKDASAKLLRSTPQEYNFPKYAGLIDQMACQAIPLRFERILTVENEMDLGVTPDTYVTLLYFKPICGPTDAVLVVRPWIRPAPEAKQDRLEALRTCLVTLWLDEKEIVREYPIEEFLVGPDGFGYRERPFTFNVIPSTVLQLGRYRGEPHEPLYGVIDPNGVSPDSGIFVTRDQTIEIRAILRKPFPGPIRVRTGLVAGLYTTRPVP